MCIKTTYRWRCKKCKGKWQVITETTHCNRSHSSHHRVKKEDRDDVVVAHCDKCRPPEEGEAAYDTESTFDQMVVGKN